MKHFIIVFFSFILTMPTMAQAPEAIGQAFAMAYRDKSAVYTDSLINVLEYKYRKYPEVLAELARAYFTNGESGKAQEKLKRIIKQYPDNPSAYIVYGDIHKYYWRFDSAEVYYDKAIELRPKSAYGYDRKLAMLEFRADSVERGDSAKSIIRDQCIAVLKQLKTIRPDYPVEQEMGDVYFSLRNFDEAVAAYSAVEDKLTGNELWKYPAALYNLGRYDESIDVIERFMDLNSQKPLLLRYKFYNLVKCKKYSTAIETYNSLISMTDTLISNDHYFALTAYLNLHDEESAIETFNKFYDRLYDNIEDIKENISAAKSNLDKNSEDLVKLAEYDEAALFNRRRYEKIKHPAFNPEYLIKMIDVYRKKYSDDLATLEQEIEACQQADAVCQELQEKHPDYIPNIVLYYRISFISTLESKNVCDLGTAIPYCESLLANVEPYPEMENRGLFLETAYRYMYSYWSTQNNIKKANEYIRKINAL